MGCYNTRLAVAAVIVVTILCAVVFGLLSHSADTGKPNVIAPTEQSSGVAPSGADADEGPGRDAAGPPTPKKATGKAKDHLAGADNAHSDGKAAAGASTTGKRTAGKGAGP